MARKEDQDNCICRTASAWIAAALALAFSGSAMGQPCGAGGNCYVPTGTPGCLNVACCNEVCAVDPFCCNVAWDGICVDEALEMCGNCGAKGKNDCFVADGDPGCADFECCAAVCAVDPFCCNMAWDTLCAQGAAALCEADVVCGNPDAGNCFEETLGQPGCSDAACCEVVCAADSFCCEVEWDGLCVEGAVKLCKAPVCGNPNAGNCFEVIKGQPGCSDAACCEVVCAADSFCCEVEWDGLCVEGAQELCKQAPVCGDPKSGNCYQVTEGVVGCNNTECCEAICAIDPFCCDVEWDGICADEAAEICGGCGGDEAGSCSVAHGTPGCSNFECCATVCALDPFCCNVAWDGLCVGGAAELCDKCPNPNCAADLDGDLDVDGIDLGILLNSWSDPAGTPGCDGALPCCADIDGNGVVDGVDLGILLLNFTGQPGGDPDCL